MTETSVPEIRLEIERRGPWSCPILVTLSEETNHSHTGRAINMTFSVQTCPHHPISLYTFKNVFITVDCVYMCPHRSVKGQFYTSSRHHIVHHNCSQSGYRAQWWNFVSFLEKQKGFSLQTTVWVGPSSVTVLAESLHLSCGLEEVWNHWQMQYLCWSLYHLLHLYRPVAIAVRKYFLPILVKVLNMTWVYKATNAF